MAATTTPENTIFIQLSFEGTDPYSQAGGLGTRVYNMGEALAEMGFETHLFFIGDPDLPNEERHVGGKYILHRWCQWISRHHPNGVYDGEQGKVNDYSNSVPAFITKKIALPAAAKGKRLVVIAEEWHTVDTLCNLSDLLNWHGIRLNATLMWNVNNIFSFHKINWGRLKYVATITAVSKFMKHMMWQYGVDPIVVPNGIPARMLKKPNAKYVKRLKEALAARGKDLNLLKIGRFDPAKRWMMAVEAVAILKQSGLRPNLMVRGGIEPHGGEVLARASAMGLNVHDVTVAVKRPTVEQSIEAIENAPADADVLNLRFFLPEEFVTLLYHCCDAVFANSGFEPFGLVGLEVMASGGIAFTGSTGEEYVFPFVNAISVETSDPKELVAYLNFLHDNPDKKEKMKKEAYNTAKQFTWKEAIENLIRRIEYLST
jgi:glycosyltransferase involved in cell wall biosynthesis